LLISADAGGPNGYRVRLWKLELAQLATDIGLAIAVCHYPPSSASTTRAGDRCHFALCCAGISTSARR